jgi:hypothetical protein
MGCRRQGDIGRRAQAHRGQRSEGAPRAGRDALDIARARRLPKILIARLAELKGRLKS